MSTAFKRALQKKKVTAASLFDQEAEQQDINKNLEVDQSSSGSSDADSDVDTTLPATAATKALISKKELKVTPAKEEEEEPSIDEEDELRAFKDADPMSKEWKNRQRTLVLCARGVNSRFRHLLNDLLSLLPQGKKESKIERKIAKDYINEICF